ncbi:hypothetical protein CYMTET_52144 [Cymbomonas tetramitiformis]|uniref:Uncharacterized protein n=1 Tax=Cymbomonas tetramitiformis TaxID=36881 RepID=A0AAE0ERM4_9CHLO|nr:hypothetical protein CYMTET_52144 [Cymbomonas tetramitiformis]
MGGVSEMSGSEVAECGESARSHEDNLFLEYEDTSYPSNTFEDYLGDSEEELCYDATSMDTLRPLYPGSACTLLQALLQLAQLVRSGTVPLAAVDRSSSSFTGILTAEKKAGIHTYRLGTVNKVTQYPELKQEFNYHFAL